MRKTFIYFATICTACAVLFSCTKEQDKQEAEIIEETADKPSGTEQGDGVYSITLMSPDTKTAFVGSYVESDHTYYKKIWTTGDRVSVNGHESQPLTADDIDMSKATFHFEEAIPSADSYQVVYPSSAYDSGTGEVTIPAVQTFNSGNFDKSADIILGYGTDLSDITLHNAVAYLKIKLLKGDYGNFGVKEVKLTASGKKLNGAFAIAEGGVALTVPESTTEESEQSITLNASAINPLLSDTPTEFLLAVAPQTLSGGFTITLTDTKDNTMEKTKLSSAELAAGGILAQQAFKFQEYHAIATPEDLLAFADSCSVGNNNYWLITDNIDMSGKTWPQAGIGDDDLTVVPPAAFRGTLNGGNNGTENGGCKISKLTSTTGAFLNYLAKNAVVKNLTLDSTCSISYSDNITANTSIGGIIGMSRGIVTYCYSRASVSCTSTSYTKGIWVGGIVGRQYRTGSVDHCYNNGTVSCSPTNGSSVVFVGGIIGSLERVKSKDNATISYCENGNSITANPDINSILHLGGVIGRIDHYQGTLSMTGLINTGDVTRTNSNKKNAIAVVVGGLIGGIHGDNLADPVTSTSIKNSHVSECTVSNGTFNNWDDASNGAGTNYATATHVGGFIGFIMGSGLGGSQLVVIDENCSVSNVDVISRRGYLGGFVSWAKGIKIDNCSVLESAAQGSLNLAYYGGGIIACGEDVIISNCNVTLTKDATHSLYTNGTQLYTGGIAGWTKGTSTIENCRAFVRNMYQGTDTPGVRGWIVGYNTGTLNIKNCGLGGTYGNSASPTITLNDENFSDYIYGSTSSPEPSLQGTQFYWDGTL